MCLIFILLLLVWRIDSNMKLLLALLLGLPSAVFALEPVSEHFFYVGLVGGYANVDWAPVISTDRATLPTNPTSAEGTGGLYGFDAGYQLNPYVQFEGEYIRLPSSSLTYSAAAHRNYGVLSSTTTMDFYAVIAKFIVPVAETGLSLFTDAGPAYQHRSDNVAEISTYEPTFGAGILYRASPNIQLEASFQYASGTGQSEKNPMDDYIPEVYAYTFKVNYLF